MSGRITPRFTFAALLFILTFIPFSTSFAQDLPDTPVLTNPADGSIQTTNTPLLEWTDAAADSYKVVIKNDLGVKVFKFSVESADVCDDFGSCSYSLVNDDLSFSENGDYSWKVVAKNTAGKAKSEAAAFTIDFPGAPVLISPSDGATVAGNTLFQWEERPAAIRYVLSVKDSTTGEKVKRTFDYPSCPSGICFYQFSIPLEPGSYTWSVSAEQPPIPNKSKSEKRAFTVGAD
jgi:hypothetical protein